MKITVSRHPILAKANPILDTYMIDPDLFEKEEIIIENGRQIIPSGTIYVDEDNEYYGIVYLDTDITDGARIGSVMTGGYYDVDGIVDPTGRLDDVTEGEGNNAVTTESPVLTAFKAHGLFAHKFSNIVIGDPAAPNSSVDI